MGLEIRQPWRAHPAVLWASVRTAAYTPMELGAVGGFEQRRGPNG